MVLGAESRVRVLAFGGEACPERQKLAQWRSPWVCLRLTLCLCCCHCLCLFVYVFYCHIFLLFFFCCCLLFVVVVVVVVE